MPPWSWKDEKILYFEKAATECLSYVIKKLTKWSETYFKF